VTVHAFPEEIAHRSRPIGGRIPIHRDDDVPDQRRSDAFVREPELGLVVRAVLQDWPDLRADLLALHVRRIRGHRDREEGDKLARPAS